MASGSISANLTSLAASTTYYYRAFVSEYNETTSSYEYRYGSVRSFTTTGSGGAPATPGWLELPAVTGTEDYFGWFYGSGGNVGTNRNYSYNYSYSWYASLWVAYPLSGTHKSGSASTSSWHYNPDIDEDLQVDIVSNSYGTMYNSASGYSRGHQCPNGSRKSDGTMNYQTYYATNQTPQLQNKFNGSIWSALENAVRGLVSSASDTVYVVTGPAYHKVGGSESVTYLTGKAEANPASLAVPNYYWKAILKVKRSGDTLTDAKAIGFWFDHKNYSDSDYTACAVSVNQIETWTGFDLFANLPAALQSTAEANDDWGDFQSF